ncbi:hypothetical protein C1646_773186 [Rhizophagus diaphanus]|nr:hypothetical protein C1646_773186 [Rhizophagus diaphanus] [Rhizophagus sp. MUCL 43196]
MSEAVSTFTTRNESLTLADEIKKYKTDALIEFLKREENLELDDDDLKVICEEKVNGRDFLKLTEEELERHGMKLRPASRLADFIKECKERKKRSFFSYKTQKDLKEVLAKYGIDGNGIGAIRQFPPKTYTLKDDDEELEQCIKEIKCRLGNMGTILADSNEAIRCEYISVILHTSLYIVKRITKKEITLAPQLEIVGEENTGRVNYAIKALEELICITEGKLYQMVIGFAQNLVQCESALQVNTVKIRESFTLKENSEEEKELCKNVKRVIEVIVGLLKDRVDVEKEPAMKKQRVQEWLFSSLSHEILTTCFSGYLNAWEFDTFFGYLDMGYHTVNS